MNTSTRATPAAAAEPAADPVRDPARGAPYRRAIVIANPVSGRGHGARAAGEVAEGLRRRGVGTEVFLTAARGDAFTRLRSLDEEADLIVAVGGDGTLREVLEGLVDPEVPVGILPSGTANVVASQLGLPRDVHHHLEILFRKKVAPIDAARVNGKLSVLVTGVGFDALAVREVERRRRGPITKWSYLGAILRAMRGYRPPRLRVHVDDRLLADEYGLVLVGNTTNYAGLLHMAAETRLDDGRFEVYLFPTGRIIELLAAGLRGVVSRLPGGAVTMRQAARVRVESQEPVPYQVDGDLGGVTPVEVEIGPNQYHLVVP